MRYLFLLICSFFWQTLVYSQVEYNYANFPNKPYKTSDGHIHVGVMQYQSYSTWGIKPINTIYNFDENGNYLNSEELNIADSLAFFGFASLAKADTIVHVGFIDNKVDTLIPRRLAVLINDSLHKFELDGVLDGRGLNDILSWNKTFINSRGNIVSIADNLVYDPPNLILYITEINFKGELVQQKLHTTAEGNLTDYLFSSVVEVVADSSIFLYGLSFDKAVISNQDFSFKYLKDKRYDELFSNNWETIETTNGKEYITSFGAFMANAQGNIYFDYPVDSGRLPMLYRYNEDFELIDRQYTLLKGNNREHCPYGNTLAIADSNNIWCSYASMQPKSYAPLDGPYRNVNSAINVVNWRLDGSVNCKQTLFNYSGTNYIPWQTITTADGGALIAGTMNRWQSGDFGLTNLIIFKVNPDCGVTNVKEIPIKIATLEIYPNPTAENITFKNMVPQKANYSIYNSVGQKVEESSTNNNTISIAHLNSGHYTILLYNTHGTYKATFLKK